MYTAELVTLFWDNYKNVERYIGGKKTKSQVSRIIEN